MNVKRFKNDIQLISGTFKYLYVYFIDLHNSQIQNMKKGKNKNEQIDMDPYSTNILQELLIHSDWKNTEEIIQLTFKAMTDIITVHGQSIKDIKSVLTTRASKSELTTGLSLKSNISDVSQAIEDISQAVETKASYNDLNSVLKDYVNRADLNELLAERHIQKQKNINDERQNLELSILKARMDEFQKEITKKVGGCVSLSEFQELLSIVQNKANITQINQALENKVSKQYLNTALQKKATKVDIEGLIAKKADSSDLDYIINSLQSKVSLSTLQKLTQVIQNKADKSDLVILANERNSHNRSQQRFMEEQMSQKLEMLKNNVESEIKSLSKQFSEDIKDLNEALLNSKKQFDIEMRKLINYSDSQINKKISKLKVQTQQDISNFKNIIRSTQEQILQKNKSELIIRDLKDQIHTRQRCQEKIYGEVDDLRKKIQEIWAKVLAKKQFIDFKSQILENMDVKVQIEDVQTALNKFQSQINSKMAQDKQDYLELLKSFQRNFNESLNITTSQTVELRKLITKKSDRNENPILQQALKKVRKQIQQCRKTVDLAYAEITSKINVKEYEIDLIEIRKRFQMINKELPLKASIKDVCVLSDSKPNIDDVNRALKEINDALEQKISEEDLQNILKDQATINQTLCSENIVGRWMWQTGDLKAGGLIPWQIECANTVPDHFFWQKDKTSILILVAGIYDITACVFNKSSIITIIVNGEAIKGKQQQNINDLNRKVAKRKKQKDMCGNKVQQFLMLPNRSRVCISCSSDVGEGFLNIRRL